MSRVQDGPRRGKHVAGDFLRDLGYLLVLCYLLFRIALHRIDSAEGPNGHTYSIS